MISIMSRTSPSFRQFLALIGSSSFITNHAITPPIIPKSIGKIYHKPERLRYSEATQNRRESFT